MMEMMRIYEAAQNKLANCNDNTETFKKSKKIKNK